MNIPPATNGKYDLPTNLRRMISIAKKYNISLDILVIPEDVKKKTYLLGTTLHQTTSQEDSTTENNEMPTVQTPNPICP